MIREMVPECVRLSDAVRLHLLHTDAFKSARLSIYTIQPAHAVHSPLSTLLYGVLRRGSVGYPSLSALNRRLDELYGTTLTVRDYLHGDCHILSFTAEMLEDAYIPGEDRGRVDLLGGTMDLFARLLLHPLLDAEGLLRAEAVEKEKQILCDSIRADRNDSRTYAYNRLRRLMCPDEPYGLSLAGEVEQVQAVTPEQLTAHFRKMLAETRCELFYVGQADRETVREKWCAAFGEWAPREAILPVTEAHRPPDDLRRFEEEMPVAQGKLCMSWSNGASALTADPQDTAAYLVLNELFGGMQDSLLFRHVREEKGLCYYCDSVYDATKGILSVYCGIRSEERDEAESGINRQMDVLRNGRFRAEDLERAKLSLITNYRQIQDSTCAMEVYWFDRAMDGSPDTPSDAIRRIRAVTPEDVRAAAGRFMPDTVYFLKGTRDDAGEGEGDDNEE